VESPSEESRHVLGPSTSRTCRPLPSPPHSSGDPAGVAAENDHDSLTLRDRREASTGAEVELTRGVTMRQKKCECGRGAR